MSDAGSSPPRYGRIPRPRGFIPLNEDANPMSVRGSGTLTNLIRSRSYVSLKTADRRKSSVVRNTEPDDEDTDSNEDLDGFRALGDRRMSSILLGPQMRSQRLIGNSNPRYRWEQYWKTAEDLKSMKKPLREYYDHTNSLIQNYLYIDQLLDSSIPHDLINEYNSEPGNGRSADVIIPPTVTELPESHTPTSDDLLQGSSTLAKKVKRTPRDLYKVFNEQTPLLSPAEVDNDDYDGPKPEIPRLEDDSVESGDRIVQIAIYVNLLANAILLVGKIAVMVLTSSLSVLASLVDAALDFLSTGIVWTTTTLIERQDQYHYPVGRRRLEPLGVLVFSVVMITAFFQVALQCLSQLTSGDHTIINLGLPAVIIMASTVLIKAACWLWCRLIKNSSVQALAQDAMTDVIFNIFSIIFPLVGYYAELWWLDALGGLLLSCYVIFNWASTSAGHIRNLTGAAATADERNLLLYLTMRFAKTIKQIQGLQAYHAGDKLNVEVDIVLDENISLRDSHDLGESLQYVLESVPTVDRAFVHQDYSSWNLPTHMEQQA